jgi:hypothetical protein
LLCKYPSFYDTVAN